MRSNAWPRAAQLHFRASSAFTVTTGSHTITFVGLDPNGSLDARPGRGKILRLIDTKGTGKADRINVFAKVDSPRGLIWDHKTLYVLHPPFLTAFHDDDGDGVSDRSEVLVLKGKDTLQLQVGFSHDVIHKIPAGVDVKVAGAKQEVIEVSGIDKQRVGQVAAEIRASRPPEPYQGKGIRYRGEYIQRKEGKKK